MRNQYDFLITLCLQKGKRSIDAGGSLYVIYYPEDADFVSNLDNRTFYVDMATI